MGLLQDIFGDRGDKVAHAENEAEKAARSDYLDEYKNTRTDPLPTEVPDWAKDIGPNQGR